MRAKHFFVIAGILVFGGGTALGAYLGLRKEKARQAPTPRLGQEEVLGEVKAPEQPSQDIAAPALATPSSSPPIRPPQADGTRGERIRKPSATPAPAPQPKPNPCELARADLTKQNEAAQKIYDREQAELSRQRSDAVNHYLTAIALATSKYNSATSTDAYLIYQQEQNAALNNYSQATTDTGSKEAALAETKKASQKKYDEALESKISGPNCP